MTSREGQLLLRHRIGKYHIEKIRGLEFYKSRSLHELDDQVLS